MCVIVRLNFSMLVNLYKYLYNYANMRDPQENYFPLSQIYQMIHTSPNGNAKLLLSKKW